MKEGWTDSLVEENIDIRNGKLQERQVFNGSVFNADETEGMSLASHTKEVRYGPVGNG